LKPARGLVKVIGLPVRFHGDEPAQIMEAATVQEDWRGGEIQNDG
jgi:hypothetical protein